MPRNIHYPKSSAVFFFYFLTYDIIQFIIYETKQLIGGELMGFQIGGSILDFVVLSTLKNKDEYGYVVTQEVKKILDISETALYPALKRLQKNGLLSTYDVPYQGRNRRYYKLTQEGKEALDTYILQWNTFKIDMDNLLEKGDSNDD